MTNEELINKMRDPAVSQEYLEEMQGILQEELDKPFEEQDQDLINDLIQNITEMTGMEETLREHAEAGIARMQQYSEQISGKRKTVRIRWLIPIACAIILLTSNVLSYSVFGMNAFSAAVQITKGGIVINYNDSAGDSEAEGNPYADEMLAICEENGFTPLVPQYIPANLKPTETWGAVSDVANSKSVIFYLSNKREKLNIHYIYANDSTFDVNVGIKTKSYNMTEENICGTTVYIIHERDTEYTISFQKDTIIYSMFFDQYDEDEIQRTLYSMFI